MAHLEDNRGRSTPELASVPLESSADRRPLPSIRWLPLLVAVAGLIIWELGSRLSLISAVYFPAPSAVFDTMKALAASGELWADVSATLVRMFWGAALGGACGLLLGLAMGWSRRVRTLAEPFIAAAHPLPKIALLPLIMVIFGIGDVSFVLVIALGAFFPMLINTMVGVAQIPPIYFDVARNYSAGRRQMFRRVVWPGARPMILSGLRLALNVSLLLAVAVEMVGSANGLGNMIWMAWGTMRVEQIYASLFVIVVLGLAINWLLNVIAVHTIPWQQHRN